jgi:hypothetical protein
VSHSVNILSGLLLGLSVLRMPETLPSQLAVLTRASLSASIGSQLHQRIQIKTQQHAESSLHRGSI